MYADLPAIAEVHRQAFGRYSEARLVAALRGSTAWVPELSLVTEQDGLLGAHLLLSRIGIEGRSEAPGLLALGPVAVRPSLQKQGVGSHLIFHALKRAALIGFTGIVVLGHAEYYPRFGFVPASRFGILPPFDVPDNTYMALELQEGSLAGVPGTVRYPEPWLRV